MPRVGFVRNFGGAPAASVYSFALIFPQDC